MDNTLHTLYATRVKKFRKEKGLSQLELELGAGLSLGTISRIENGKINPTKETLLKIAVALQLKQHQTIKLFSIDTFISQL